MKQGYYDYMYAVVPKSGESVNLVTMQNNFYQTPNEYEVRVYLYDYNLMCYKFIGYRTVKGEL